MDVDSGCRFFLRGTRLYKLSDSRFSLAQLGGLPEVLPGHGQQRLATTGIRARVRHPVYLGHLCEMLAWSVGTGLAVCWALTAFAIATGAVMIRLEDRKLEKRFGEKYGQYRIRVPAVLPKNQADDAVSRAPVSSALRIIRVLQPADCGRPHAL